MIKSIIIKIPTPMCGLALAFAALGNLLGNHIYIAKIIMGVMGALIIAGYLTRVLIDRVGLKQELKKTVPLTVLPTCFMTIFILSEYIVGSLPILAKILWIAGLVAFGVTLIVFIKKHIFCFDIDNVFPSWFVITVGYMVAAVSSKSLGFEKAGAILVYIGFTMYIIVLMIISYRIFIRGDQKGSKGIKSLGEDVRPTFCIYAAPANLCMVGHFNVFGEDINQIILAILVALAIPSYIMVVTCLPKLLKIPFYPSYAAFTFPLVISAVAMEKAIEHFGINVYWPVQAIYGAMVALAATMVVYVFIKYCKFLTKFR